MAGMTPKERAVWRQRLLDVTPGVTDEYPGNPDYITFAEFEKMIAVLFAAVAEERGACAKMVEETETYGDELTRVQVNLQKSQIAAAIRARS